jgi:putative hemolysin
MIAMILWFLIIRHSGTLLVSCSSPQFNKCSLSSYPIKAKYIELMGKEKRYNSSYVYCQAKGWSKKS